MSPQVRINDSMTFFLLNAIKNVTGIFSCLFDGSLVWFENEPNPMEIPSFSWQMPRKFHVICRHNSTWSGGGSVQIDIKFYDYSMSFIQVLSVFHAGTWQGFWIRSSHGISMAFAKKMMGFPSDSVSFSNQTKLLSIWHEKIHVTFFTGVIMIFMFRD